MTALALTAALAFATTAQSVSTEPSDHTVCWSEAGVPECVTQLSRESQERWSLTPLSQGLGVAILRGVRALRLVSPGPVAYSIHGADGELLCWGEVLVEESCVRVVCLERPGSVAPFLPRPAQVAHPRKESL